MPKKETRLKNITGVQVIGRNKDGKPITAYKPRTVYTHTDSEEVKVQKEKIKEDAKGRLSLDEAARELFWVEQIASTNEIIAKLYKRGLIPSTLLDKDKKVTPECKYRINEMKIGQRADRKYLSNLERIALDESANERPLDEVIGIIKSQIGFHKNLLNDEGELSESGRIFIQRRMIEGELLGKIREACASTGTLKDVMEKLINNDAEGCLIPDEYININNYGKKEASESFKNYITRQIIKTRRATKNPTIRAPKNGEYRSDR